MSAFDDAAARIERAKQIKAMYRGKPEPMPYQCEHGIREGWHCGKCGGIVAKPAPVREEG